MKRLLILFSVLILVISMVGCSDDDDNVPTGGNTNTSTSTWNASGEYWSTNVDATSSSDFVYFSFTSKDTVGGVTAKPQAVLWDIAFKREVIKTNGGTSTDNSGDVSAVSLGMVNFADVTIDDATGVTWESDFIDYFIDEWFMYNSSNHTSTITRKVYSMQDATGDHFVKFQIDSMVGAAQPPDMGTIYMKYYYNPTASSSDLSGSTVETSIVVGANHTYFDFSTGQTVTPTDPSNSLDWDIGFYAYDLFQNSGPSGIGDCAAFLAWSEIADSSDIDAFTAQPVGAPLFPDIPGSAMTEWYNYTGPPNHQLPSKSEVYLLKTGGSVYKLRIESYYGEGGAMGSGHYNFIWSEL